MDWNLEVKTLNLVKWFDQKLFLSKSVQTEIFIHLTRVEATLYEINIPFRDTKKEFDFFILYILSEMNLYLCIFPSFCLRDDMIQSMCLLYSTCKGGKLSQHDSMLLLSSAWPLSLSGIKEGNSLHADLSILFFKWGNNDFTFLQANSPSWMKQKKFEKKYDSRLKPNCMNMSY